MSDGEPAGEPIADASRQNVGPFDVLQVNKLYHPVVGGIETVVRDIATGLASRGHESRVLAATPFGRGSLSSEQGVRVRKTASLGRVQSVPLSPSYPVRLHQEAQDVDIVHYHLPNPLGPVSHALTPSTTARTVVTYHSDIVRQQTALRLYAPILRSFLDDVDRILVTSPRLLDHSEFLTPHREKCSIVPLSIDVDRVIASANDNNHTRMNSLPNDYDLPRDADEQVVLFVGRLNYYKGVEYLVDAMQTVEATLLVVGEGERRQALERQARECGVAERVHYLGQVSDEVLDCCFAFSDLFVLPSIEPSEAFGLVQLEAMAHELPVVNTDLPTGVPWVSRDGETGVTVPPRNSQALATAISELLDNDDRRQALAKNGRDRVLEEFTHGQILSRIEAIYDDILSNDST